MLRTMKLGHKISVGFGLILVVLLVVSVVGLKSLGEIEDLAHDSDAATHLLSEAVTTTGFFEAYLVDRDEKHLEETRTLVKEIISEGEDLIRHLSDGNQKELVEEFISLKKQWVKLFEEYIKEDNRIVNLEEAMDEIGVKGSEDVERYVGVLGDRLDKLVASEASANSIKAASEKMHQYLLLEALFPQLQLVGMEFLVVQSTEHVREIDELFERFDEVLAEIRKLDHRQEERAQLEKIEKVLRNYKDHMTDFKELVTAHTTSTLEMSHEVETIIALTESFKEDNSKVMHSSITGTRTTVMGFVVAGMVGGVLLAIFITLGITRPINRVIQGLSGESVHVASASNEVSASSQNLAQGASEQAANLEEISSSLEQIKVMTRQSADNATTANEYMENSREKSVEGKEAMNRLSNAIIDIRQSTDKTSIIVKNIEEIAFQTNLLALNAAVEAARAGGAGKGFAVVAQEVRNLAQRASEAAKDTAALIETARESSEHGEGISVETANIIAEISDSAEQASGLVKEITNASTEQASGVAQITTAVAQMSQVTQSNAANAEEFSSASMQLSSQSLSLRELISELRRTVHGIGGASDLHKSSDLSTEPKHFGSIRYKELSSSGTSVPEVSAEDVIPFDEGTDHNGDEKVF